MKPIRYTEAMIQEFVAKGHWTDETFFDFYERNARELGDREALVDSRYRVTWAEAKRLADAIASAWIDDGIARDERVIIQAPNSVYGFLARIACERAGLISLTVMPYMREAEIENFLEKTGAAMAVIPRSYRGFDYLSMYQAQQQRFPGLKHIYLFDEEPVGSCKSLPATARAYLEKIDTKALSRRRLDPLHDVALLTTTTGTTGLPKLVEWPMAPRLCTSKARVDLWQLTKDDITMAIAPHAGGAAGTLTFFAAPLVGAKTVMLEEFDPKQALAIMERERVTAIGLVPTHLVKMLEQDVESYDLSALRFIRSAGGYLSPQLAAEAERRFGAIITSDLGTQDKGSVSGCRMDDTADLRRRTVGHLLPGNELRLIGLDGREVAPGEPGVLWLRGPHSPAGFWRDEAAAAEIFDKDGWCTTEDIVKLDNGCVWILGRAKDIIIRGGQNIYPAEIEGLLNEHPSVAAVAVVGYPDSTYGERACAFVVPRGQAGFSFADMTDFLGAKRIARYKFPERLEIIQSLPTVGDSGKVDKKVLRSELSSAA
jgi:non-ribosomal peptide synthetase component E (peptide arylation enzyme)